MSERATDIPTLKPVMTTWRPAMPYLLHAGVWLVFAGFVWMGMSWLGSPQNWPIQHVRIEGELHHTDRASMARNLEVQLQKGFFAMDNRAVVQAAEQLPWIRKAHVQKVWPDTLVLSVEEQVPVAHWNQTDLLSEYGQRFTPDSTEGVGSLPKLMGVNGHEKQVLQVYAEVVTPLAELGLQLESLAKSDHGAWHAKLDNGLVIQIGQKHPVGPLLQTISQLKQLGEQRFQNIQQVDMRYPNGVAIAWKKGYTPDWVRGDGKSVAWVLSRKEQG